MKRKCLISILILALTMGIGFGGAVFAEEPANEPQYTPVEMNWQNGGKEPLPKNEQNQSYYYGAVGKDEAGNEELVAFAFSDVNLYDESKIKDGVLTITQQMRINEYPGDQADTWAYYAPLLTNQLPEELSADPKNAVGGQLDYVTGKGSENAYIDIADNGWINERVHFTVDNRYPVSMSFRISETGTEIYFNGKLLRSSTTFKLADFETSGAYLYNIFYINNTIRGQSNPDAAWGVTYEGVYNDGYPSQSQDAMLSFGEAVNGWTPEAGTEVDARVGGGISMANGIVASETQYDLKKGVVVEFDVTDVPVWQGEQEDDDSYISIGFRDKRTWDDAAGNGFTAKYRPDNAETTYGSVHAQYDVGVASQNAYKNYGKVNSKLPVTDKRHTIGIFYVDDSWVLALDGEWKTFDFDSHIFGIGDLSKAYVFVNVESSTGSFGVDLVSIRAAGENDWASASGSVSASENGETVIDQQIATNSVFLRKAGVSTKKTVELIVTPERIPEFSDNGRSEGQFGLFLSSVAGNTDPSDTKSFAAFFSFADADTLCAELHMGKESREISVAYERGKPVTVRFGFDADKRSVIEINGIVVMRGAVNPNHFVADTGYLTVQTLNDISAAEGWKLKLAVKESDRTFEAEKPADEKVPEKGGCGGNASAAAMLTAFGMAAVCVGKRFF